MNSLKNLSLKDIIPKREDEKKELDFKMFSRFSAPKGNKSLKKSNEKFDKIRKILMRYILEKKVIVILTTIKLNREHFKCDNAVHHKTPTALTRETHPVVHTWVV